jgi:hypothetical protein
MYLCAWKSVLAREQHKVVGATSAFAPLRRWFSLVYCTVDIFRGFFKGCEHHTNFFEVKCFYFIQYGGQLKWQIMSRTSSIPIKILMFFSNFSNLSFKSLYWHNIRSPAACSWHTQREIMPSLDSFIVETSPLYFLILFGVTLCVDFPGYKQAARVALMSFS